MLGYFVLIVVTTIIWIIPIDAQAYRPTLHKRHNDGVYKVNLDQDFTARHLVGRRQFSRDSNLPPLLYHQNNLIPYSAVMPLNRLRDDVLLRKIDELTTLVKFILIRSLDGDEKVQVKSRKNFLYETDDRKTDENLSAMWLLPQIRNFGIKKENSGDSSVTQTTRGAIPYEEEDVSLLKKSQAGERGGNVSSMRLQEPH